MEDFKKERCSLCQKEEWIGCEFSTKTFYCGSCLKSKEENGR